MKDFVVPVPDYQSFNEFFYRKLVPGARSPASIDQSVVCSPADCRTLCFDSIGVATNFWIKGANFTATNLLQDPVMGSYYNEGSIAICRLAPQDYHRFHSPIDGHLWGLKTIEGHFYTVNPMAVREELDVYTENKRTLCYIRSSIFGNVAFVAIGATMVGSVIMTIENESKVSKFDELGYFAFGGSTVVLLFKKDAIQFDQDLLINSQESLETLLQVGNSIGRHIFHST